MGNRTRKDSDGRVCCHAHRLVEALAGRREDGEQGRTRGRALSRLEFAALKYLYEESKITASGHETTDTDPGLATTKDDYSLEAYIPKAAPVSPLASWRSCLDAFAYGFAIC